MKKRKSSKVLAGLYLSSALVVSSALYPLSSTMAEEVTSAPLVTDVTVVNNIVGTKDKVTVTGLATGDVVNVYSAATGGTALVTSPALVDADNGTAVLEVDQISAGAGTLYVSVKSTDKLESKRTAVKYDSETSKALLTTAVKVTNNKTGAADTVEVSGLASGDVVKVYSAATGGAALDTATATGSTATISKEDLLTVTGGTIYVTVTKTGKLESARTAVKYITEPVSTAPAATKIAVVNNIVGTKDKVTVTGLATGDVVNVYSAATGGTALVTSPALVDADNGTAVLEVDQISAGAGTLYVSVKSTDKLESKRTAVKYDSETSKALLTTAVKVTNNKTGAADTVEVSGLASGDVVKVYSAATGGAALDTATATGSTATISKEDLLTVTGGTIYVTVTKTGKLESARTAVKYITEPVSTAPAATKIAVVNNIVGTKDKVTVTGLATGDVVNVYSAATGGTALVTSPALVDADNGTAVLEVDQISAGAGTLYVSVKSTDKLESKRTAVKYDSETSKALLTTAVKVTNNKTGAADTVEVSGLASGDVVKVYSAATGGAALDTATATGSTATISKEDLLTVTGGTIYVTVTKTGKLESARTAVKYITEPVTTAPALSAITVTNNTTTKTDSVVVSGVVEGDIVTVYVAATGTTKIGSPVTVGTGATSATISGVDLLTQAGGTVYVTVKNTGKLESKRVAVKYLSDVTVAPLASNIAVLNNEGSADIVKVTGLAAGDVVNVYSVVTGGTSIGSGTVQSGKTSVDISISQLGTSAGKIYVTVTKTDKSESIRVVKDYIAE